MANKNNELKMLKLRIAGVLRKEGIRKAGIFGSFVRGEQRKNSDIDILIKPTKDMSLLGFVKVKLELEDTLRRRVDLLSYNGIHPLLKEQILREEVRII